MNDVIIIEPFAVPALPALLASARARAHARSAFVQREARSLPVAYEPSASRVEVAFFTRLLVTFLITVVGGLAFLGPDVF